MSAENPPRAPEGARRPAWRDPVVWRIWLAQGAIGAALGLFLVVLILVVEGGAGWLAVRGVAPASVAASALVLGLGRALLVGVIEEAIFRGLILEYLRGPIGTPAAVVVSSLAFAAVHAFNTNVTPLALANLAGAGLLFALAYLVGRGLALPIGLHAAWNFFEGSVFGFPVSGSSRDSLLQIEVGGPELATGGAFGPEGGAVALLAMAATAGLLWLARARVPLVAPAGAAGVHSDRGG